MMFLFFLLCLESVVGSVKEEPLCPVQINVFPCNYIPLSPAIGDGIDCSNFRVETIEVTLKRLSSCGCTQFGYFRADYVWFNGSQNVLGDIFGGLKFKSIFVRNGGIKSIDDDFLDKYRNPLTETYELDLSGNSFDKGSLVSLVRRLI